MYACASRLRKLCSISKCAKYSHPRTTHTHFTMLRCDAWIPHTVHKQQLLIRRAAYNHYPVALASVYLWRACKTEYTA
jgi:hypothetical protein